MSQHILRRYTDIPSLVYMLKTSKISLLDPETWDDSNDSYFLELYRTKKKLARVRALCFTQSKETYHHWRVFAGGTGGVCVQFQKEQLLQAIARHPGIQARAVTYEKIEITEGGNRPEVDRLPFLKRIGFEPEEEFRLVFGSAQDSADPTEDVEITPACVENISLSPWTVERVATSVGELLRQIPGWDHVTVGRSTLIDSKRWKRFGDRAVVGHK